MATNFSNKNISTIQLQGIDYHLKSIPFHATEEEWKLINYIPKQGETVVYDIDGKNQNLRFKTGDGFTQVKNLPFSLSTVQETQSQIDKAVAEKSRVEIIAQETSEFLPTLTIHQLTQEEYEQKIADGSFEQNVLYLTPDEEIDLSPYATEEYVDNKVAGMVDSAPETLDTLNELAKALGDDPNFATTIATNIGKKVDKIDGKGLSTNDYTTEEKNKLEQLSNFVGDAKVSDQINQAIANIDIPDEIYVQNDEPIDAEDDTLWLDLDEEGKSDSLSAVLYTNQYLTEEQQEQARKNINAVSTDNIGYVTPEMFGAKGDGVTDDTQAINQALNAGVPVMMCGSYAVSATMQGNAPAIYGMDAKIILLNDLGTVFRLENAKYIYGLSFLCNEKGVISCVYASDIESVEICNIRIENVKDMRTASGSSLIAVAEVPTVNIHDIHTENCVHIGNGSIADDGGSISCIYVSGHTKQCTITNVTGKDIHNIDVDGNYLFEDSNVIYVQAEDENAETCIRDVYGYNYGKRLIKTQCGGSVIVDGVTSYTNSVENLSTIGILPGTGSTKGKATISNCSLVNEYAEATNGQYLITSSVPAVVTNCILSSGNQWSVFSEDDFTINGCDIRGKGVQISKGNASVLNCKFDTIYAVHNYTASDGIVTISCCESYTGRNNIEIRNAKLFVTGCKFYSIDRITVGKYGYIADTFMQGTHQSINTIDGSEAELICKNLTMVARKAYETEYAIDVRGNTKLVVENLTAIDYMYDVVAYTGTNVYLKGVNMEKVHGKGATTFDNYPEYVNTFPSEQVTAEGAKVIKIANNKMYKLVNGLWSAVDNQ